MQGVFYYCDNFGTAMKIKTKRAHSFEQLKTKEPILSDRLLVRVE